jgi:hypothetical protein
MNKAIKNYIGVYVAHIASIVFLIICEQNHWPKWLPLSCALLTPGFFIYLFWKNENLPKETKLIRAVLLFLFFQLAAFIFVLIKLSERRSSNT